jgi:hypothetical protein
MAQANWGPGGISNSVTLRILFGDCHAALTSLERVRVEKFG